MASKKIPTSSRYGIAASLASKANKVAISQANSSSNNVSNSNSNIDSSMSSTNTSMLSTIKSNSTLSNTSIQSVLADETVTNGSNNASSVTNSSISSGIGGISMSRSSSLASRSTSASTMNKSKTTNSFQTNNNETTSNLSSNGGCDLIKKIEDLVARNKTLEEENIVLRNLIHEETSSSTTVASGAGSFVESTKFDERRVLMLKCQIYQLEKQINILSKLLSFRKNAHTDAINTIGLLADSFRSISQRAENSSNLNANSGYYSIDKNELLKWIELTESTRIKLIKTQDSDLDYNENLSETTLFDSEYSKSSLKKVDILDVCSGNLNYINLKQISFLESDLSNLFKKLVRLKECLKTNLNSSQNSQISPSSKSSNTKAKSKSNFVPVHKENMNSQLEECIKSTRETCKNLFDLTLIVPSAPWQKIKLSPITELKEETLLSKLKTIGLPKTKAQSVEIILKSFYVASNYHYHMKSLECAALTDEIKFYRSCHSIQKSYIESVISLLKTKYEQFIDELKQNFNQPLRILIERFWKMKDDTSEQNLREFLGLFKVYAKKFDNVLTTLDESMSSVVNNDIITSTFDNLIGSLDQEISNLNKQCLNNMETFNMNALNLNELSTQSDKLFLDIISNNDENALPAF